MIKPRYSLQQAPIGISQYSAGSICPSRQIIDYGTSLPQSAIQKIQEFKALMNKYPKYHTNPNGIIRWAIFSSINGDNTLRSWNIFDPLTVYQNFTSVHRKEGNQMMTWSPFRLDRFF